MKPGVALVQEFRILTADLHAITLGSFELIVILADVLVPVPVLVPAAVASNVEIQPAASVP